VTAPSVSVIVPTRDRAESLLRLLQALAQQDVVPGGFEVIAIADGCADRTAARVSARSWPFDLHVLALAPSGPALARNCGVALARGEILLFLDDDVEPAAGVVRAHAELHQAHERQIGLGYLPTVPSGAGFFAAALRGWWEAMFDGPRRPGHRYVFRNLLGGHFSIRRARFEELGGFDANLRCHEDWEFGYRAIESGLQLAFIPTAVAWHHDGTDVPRALMRKLEEGKADVQLARIHPELARALPIGWTIANGVERSRIADLAWHHPQLGDRLFRALVHLLPTYEHWRLRFRWRALLERAMRYWYWRGVAEAIGTPEELAALLPERPPRVEPDLAIDLSDGLDAACSRVDEQRPRSLHLVYRGRPLGDIRDEPGGEHLRGVHLRVALAGHLLLPFAQALADEHELPEPLAALLRAQAAKTEHARAGAHEAFAA